MEQLLPHLYERGSLFNGSDGQVCPAPPPSPSEVIKAIQGLNGTGATGVDGIPVSVLKLASQVIALPIAHMIALLFSSEHVPSAIKAAIVVPIHKGKGKPASSPSSYIPVAILLALSKALEKIVL